MTLYMIGIGLRDEKDITVKGLEYVKNSDYVFLEDYTSKLINSSVEHLSSYYGKQIVLADREMVEKKSDEILENAKDSNVSFLVVGDVFTATTHTDLFLRAKELGVKVEVVFNAGVMNAVGITGLQLYKFGKTTSIVYPEDNFSPETFYDVVKMNKANGLHTLCLLDIKKDQNRFMTVNEAIDLFMQVEEKRQEKVFSSESLIVGCARLGSENFIKFGKASKIKEIDFGAEPHCLIVPGELHFMEQEFLEKF